MESMVDMTEHTAFAPVQALARAWATMAEELRGAPEGTPSVRLKASLDCDPRVADYLRSRLDFVDYVETDRDADVRIHVRTAQAPGDSPSCTVTFVGLGRFENIEATVRVEDDGLRVSRPARRASNATRTRPASRAAAVQPGALEGAGHI